MAALGTCVAGFVAGVVGIVVARPLIDATGIDQRAAFEVVAGNLIQIGFAAFGLGYLFLRDDREQFLRIRVPTLEDVAWIIAIPIVFVAMGSVLEAIFSAIGLVPSVEHGDGSGTGIGTDPIRWLVAFVGLYLFAAPAEELVYRGIVQGRLRRAFDTPGVVAVSALSFGLLHLLIGLLQPEVGVDGALYWGLQTAVSGGLVWGYAYERTENLLVTSVTHAMEWTLPLSAILAAL